MSGRRVAMGKGGKSSMLVLPNARDGISLPMKSAVKMSNSEALLTGVENKVLGSTRSRADVTSGILNTSEPVECMSYKLMSDLKLLSAEKKHTKSEFIMKSWS